MYKDKLVQHLYQYTSKELSFGCEVLCVHPDTGHQFYDVINETERLSMERCRHEGLPHWYGGSHFITHGYLQTMDEKIAGRRGGIENVFRLVTVIGHPPQWHHLLLALPKGDEVSLDTSHVDGGNHLFIGEEYIDLTTNLQDIPEKDAEKLCQLLNIE